jgi:hypothetical protein
VQQGLRIQTIDEETKMKTGLISGGIALIATLGISALALAGPAGDNDGDGLFDVLDNCSVDFQDTGSGQDCDTDDDGYGNFCDGDFDNGLSTDSGDFGIWFGDFSGSGTDGGTGTDMDCGGTVDSGDFGLFFPQFSGSGVPGPSGLFCAGDPPCNL